MPTRQFCNDPSTIREKKVGRQPFGKHFFLKYRLHVFVSQRIDPVQPLFYKQCGCLINNGICFFFFFKILKASHTYDIDRTIPTGMFGFQNPKLDLLRIQGTFLCFTFQKAHNLVQIFFYCINGFSQIMTRLIYYHINI